ncbi:hypothetical protein HNQ53_000830 [Microbulbifer hydrolyticus]|uniref:Uncharacterized protein n=1 Tax=Microbulbifer hydrolyticus TaxID=48074 RepID=A0AA89PT41_9GAMM|nr:hypothetical protein [Microbulbifer hydrolyticus]
MPVRKSIFQYAVMAVLLFTLFTGVQYLKGRELEYAIEFGILWAFITSSIFLIFRIRNFKNRVACKRCNDIPEQ